MTRVMVHKLNALGQSVVQYDADVEQVMPGGIRVVAHWERAMLDLGYVRFEPGDRFDEWFFHDRWYNIFAIHAGETDVIKGWYCNIAEPALISHQEIASRDLFLDLWVEPTGAMLVLDEDEFDADQSMSATTRVAARDALAELQARVRERIAPFDAITP